MFNLWHLYNLVFNLSCYFYLLPCRYFILLKSAYKAFKTKDSSDIEQVYLEQSDLCMLHLFESFLESAPQLVLQIYVIAMLKKWKFWTGKIFFSFF